MIQSNEGDTLRHLTADHAPGKVTIREEMEGTTTTFETGYTQQTTRFSFDGKYLGVNAVTDQVGHAIFIYDLEQKKAIYKYETVQRGVLSSKH